MSKIEEKREETELEKMEQQIESVIAKMNKHEGIKGTNSLMVLASKFKGYEQRCLTSSKPKPPFGKIKKMPPEALVCPHCGKTITELRYTENGYMRIRDHAEDGDGMDSPERVHYCPECGEEIEYEALEEAGVF